MVTDLIYETDKVKRNMAAMYHVTIAPDAEAEGAVLAAIEALKIARRLAHYLYSLQHNKGWDEYSKNSFEIQQIDAALARFVVEADAVGEEA